MFVNGCHYKMCSGVIIYNGQQRKAVTKLACSKKQRKILIGRHFLDFGFKCPVVLKGKQLSRKIGIIIEVRIQHCVRRWLETQEKGKLAKSLLFDT